MQTYEYEKNLPIRRKIREKDSYKKRDRKHVTRSADSLRRAKRAFERIVRANIRGNDTPTLFTFTMYQKLSYSASSRVFSRFIDRLRRLHGKSFRYIAVPEFQKRGAVHWHVLFWGFPIEYGCTGHMEVRRGRKVFIETCTSERKCERKTRYISRLWLHGFVDGIATDGSPRLAGYLAKYMSKSLSDIRLNGKRAYASSHNILRPMSFSSSAFTIETAVKLALFQSGNQAVDNTPLQEKVFNTEWLGRANYKLFRIEPYASIENTSDPFEGQ